MKYPASRSPYCLSAPAARTFANVVAFAEKSHALPLGWSPPPPDRWHAVKWVNPAARACCSAFSMRGEMQPDVVGSFTEQPSGGKEPLALRGAELALAFWLPPTAVPFFGLPSAASISFLRR